MRTREARLLYSYSFDSRSLLFLKHIKVAKVFTRSIAAELFVRQRYIWATSEETAERVPCSFEKYAMFLLHRGNVDFGFHNLSSYTEGSILSISP